MRSQPVTFIFKGSIRTLFLIGICFMFNTGAQAQKSWTLQECIEHALKNNITIKQSEISSEIANVNYVQSKATMFPDLNASGSYSYNFGRSVDPFTNDFTNSEIQSANISLNGGVTVFGGFQLMNTLAQSKYDFYAGKENLQKIKNDIALNVAASFLQVLYGKESLKAANDRLNAATETRNRTRLMVEAGSMAQGNLLDAEAAMAAEELAVVNAENLLKSATINLMQLLELKPADGFEVTVPATEFPEQSSVAMNPDDIYSTSVKILPEFRAAAYNLQSAEKGLAIAKGGRYPRLSLFGSLSTGYSNARTRFAGSPVFLGYLPNGSVTSSGDEVLTPAFDYRSEKVPFNDQLDENYNKSAGISISIPIFNGWATESAIKRAKLNLENIKYNQLQTQNQVYKSIFQAHADAVSGQKKFYAAEKSANANKEALSYAEKKYNVGMMSSVEFLNVRNNAAKAESDLLQAKYDLIFRIKVLDFYLGKPLAF
ncbi:MAG: TolC family protein [Bacteroidetes bacterium]|nr:TolC family protein [Bacteroidota bacterium]MBK7968199.1 TolC family protein [Bacteroidota bacterium]MBK8873231.1 TolC family protein [Bacteroidota bacterium]MBK9423963.1 TolC family protein [Bacteroidota bacterium]MBL0073293.1 TolC family protein [Bacteroidota bacterium]